MARGQRESLWHAHPARPGPEFGSLLESQWWPREHLEELQAEELRGSWRPQRASRSIVSAFVRQTGSADIRTIADIRRFPILERADVERLGIKGLKVPGSFGMRASTSGSLGTPVEFLWPLSRCAGSMPAKHAPAAGSAGGRPAEPRGALPSGRPPQAVSAVLLNAKALHAPSVADGPSSSPTCRSLEGRPDAGLGSLERALRGRARAARGRPDGPAESLLERRESSPSRTTAAAWRRRSVHGVRALRDDGDGARRARMSGGRLAARPGRGASSPRSFGPDGRRRPRGDRRRAADVAPQSRDAAHSLSRRGPGDRAQSRSAVAAAVSPFSERLWALARLLRTRSGDLVSPCQAVEAVLPGMRTALSTSR